MLLGGYFGTWARAEEIWDLPLDPEVMREAGLTFGCGIVGVLGAGTCGVSAAARIMRFMARESAAQCGPCVYGLDALGSAVTRVATGHARGDDLQRIERLVGITAGRGACHHPDGAVQHMASALDVFGDEFQHHARKGSCSTTGGGPGVG
ncbi:MAG TPA: NADH-ubiquinone oxidoreductase-F iron-sulfur binding region domain-containing protein [Candidatus Limnocylindrales bacterium]